jgi:energy-coupling factor transporter ATP-binding protein EcfA2
MHDTTTPPEVAAVRHILGAPAIAQRTEAYVLDGSLDFAGLEREAETMSGGEALLVRIASELWNAERAAGLWELVRRLDRGNFERVLEALWIARGATVHDLVAAAVRPDVMAA